MLLQTEHSRKLALTSRTAAARASASSSLDRRMWKARRCALLLPMPGSFLSSSISLTIGSANLDMRLVRILEPRNAHTTEHSAHRGFQGFIYIPAGAVDRGRHQVLQHFDVAGFHGFWIN